MWDLYITELSWYSLNIPRSSNLWFFLRKSWHLKSWSAHLFQVAAAAKLGSSFDGDALHGSRTGLGKSINWFITCLLLYVRATIHYYLLYSYWFVVASPYLYDLLCYLYQFIVSFHPYWLILFAFVPAIERWKLTATNLSFECSPQCTAVRIWAFRRAVYVLQMLSYLCTKNCYRKIWNQNKTR